jgi:hypothetical protein
MKQYLRVLIRVESVSRKIILIKRNENNGEIKTLTE